MPLLSSVTSGAFVPRDDLRRTGFGRRRRPAAAAACWSQTCDSAVWTHSWRSGDACWGDRGGGTPQGPTPCLSALQLRVCGWVGSPGGEPATEPGKDETTGRDACPFAVSNTVKLGFKPRPGSEEPISWAPRSPDAVPCDGRCWTSNQTVVLGTSLWIGRGSPGGAATQGPEEPRAPATADGD